jgi:hypothetical protein
MGKIRLMIMLLSALAMNAIAPIVALADSTWTVYNASNSPLPTDLVSSIYFDNAGHQYTGTSGGGLAVKTDSAWVIWNQSNTGVPIDVARLEERDSLGNLWVGSASGNLDVAPYGFGVARLSASDSSWSMQNSGLEISQIVTGIILYDGNRYVSTYGGGITIYGPLGWIRYRYASRTEFSYADSQQHTFDVPPGTYIPSNYIRALDLNRIDSAVWMATADGGAVKYLHGAWTKFNAGNSGLPSNQLLAVRVNPRNGIVGFGTAGAGFAILSETTWTAYNQGNSPLLDGYISTIEYRPANDEIWIGTGHGVWVFQPDGNWRSYMAPDNDFISGEFYSDISFDSTDVVWVAAYGSGMASLDFKVSPPPPPVDTLHVDVDRFYIFLPRHHHAGRLYTEMDIANAPLLSGNDTVALFLTTAIGELYNFQIPFSEFHRNHWHWGHRTTYSYYHHHLLVLLFINDRDSSDVRATIADFDADMDPDNFANVITLTFRLGDRQGQHVINLRHGHHGEAPELALLSIDDSSDIYEADSGAAGIADEEASLAADITLTNYPNPFNGRTMISFDLPAPSQVELDVYDVLGRRIDRIYSGNLSAGRHRFAWPGASTSAGDISSGVFYYRLVVNDKSLTGKMLFLK